MYAEMLWATLRTLRNVNSSEMTPRQPAVPNLIMRVAPSYKMGRPPATGLNQPGGIVARNRQDRRRTVPEHSLRRRSERDLREHGAPMSRQHHEVRLLAGLADLLRRR